MNIMKCLNHWCKLVSTWDYSARFEMIGVCFRIMLFDDIWEQQLFTDVNHCTNVIFLFFPSGFSVHNIATLFAHKSIKRSSATPVVADLHLGTHVAKISMNGIACWERWCSYSINGCGFLHRWEPSSWSWVTFGCMCSWSVQIDFVRIVFGAKGDKTATQAPLRTMEICSNKIRFTGPRNINL